MKSVKLCLAILSKFILILPAVCAFSQAVPNVQQSFNLFNSGNVNSAVESLRSALSQQQDDPVLRISLGVMLAVERQYNEAVKQFTAAAKIIPTDPLPLLLAESAYDEVDNEKQAEIIRAKADSLLKNGDARKNLAKSANMLQVAIAKYPDSAILHNLLGDIYQLLGENHQAVESYKSAAKLATWWIKPLFNLAMAYLPKDPKAAADSFEKVIELDPKNLRAYLWLGDAYEKQSKYSEALLAYKKAEGSKELSNQAAIRIGNIYLKQGSIPKAKDIFEKVAKDDPDNAAAKAGLAESYIREGQFKKGIEAFNETAKLVLPSSPKESKITVLNNLANAYIGAGEYEKAIKILHEIIELDPSFGDSFTAIVAVYRKANLLEKGIEYYWQKMRNEPVNPADALILAELLLESGDFESAKKTFNTVLQSTKSEPFITRAKSGLARIKKESK